MLKRDHKFNGLPLTTFSLGELPCVKPHQMSHSSNAQFYPTELDRLTNCTVDTLLNKTHDSRYKTLNLTVSEHDIQYTSRIDTIIH